MTTSDDRPRWLEQLDRLMSLKTQIVVHGNIHDRVPLTYADAQGGTQVTYLGLRPFLKQYFSHKGYALVGFYDIVDGLRFDDPQDYRTFARIAGLDAEIAAPAKDGAPPPDFLRDTAQAITAIRKAVAGIETATVIIFDFASRLVTTPERLPTEERENFVRLAKCALESSRLKGGDGVLNNLTVLVCDKLNDLPTWMYLNNPLIGSIPIELPGECERRSYFRMNMNTFYGVEATPPEPDAWVDSFVGYTAGLRQHDLLGLQTLGNTMRHPAATERDIRALIDLYKFGVKDNPWENIDDSRRERFLKAPEILSARVKGQDHAIRAVVDVLKRATMGLSGVQQSHSQKPRGVLFFAGPTGVGKTELAKALAELIFNDQDACIRFDMSEYGTPHSDQKLMGAPPGYVGYQEGGQLTNRMRSNPFSVLLFDEVEKAHPSILDKFLQVLDDGRMTDGRGETVYFSEAIVIFTSNLGTYVTDDERLGPRRRANIKPHGLVCRKCDAGEYLFDDSRTCPHCGADGLVLEPTPYGVVETRIMEAIQDEFKVRLGRPELFNRFGNNFVVFDYIRTEVMRAIVKMNLKRLTRDLAERRKIDLEVTDAAVDELVRQVEAGDSEMGARGVVNRIETSLVNPLARALFDEDIGSGRRVVVKAVRSKRDGARVSHHLDLEYD